jgi:hypothetical protein
MNTPIMTQSESRKIARPLKMLIPMIQSELQQGNAAGQEHYRLAGEMLIEAKRQVAPGTWGKWLTKNFDLSRRQAQVYMQWARMRVDDAQPEFASLSQMTGHTERYHDRAKQQQEFRRVLRDVARDDFVQARQARDEEIKLHRELAEELIEIGYRALALKLHPDRGGAKIAMSRLNCVHDDLKRYAQTRRFGG